MNPRNPDIMLSYVQFYPTLRCNYSCHFCFNRHLSFTDDVKIHDFRKIVSILKKKDINDIDILGGEPTLHPKLPQLVDILISHGFKSTISSNGTNVHVLNGLSEKYPKESLKIGISVNMDVLSEELHEYIIKYRPILKTLFSKKSVIPNACKRYMQIPGIEYFLLYMDILDDKDLGYSIPFYSFYKELSKLKDTIKNIDGVYCSGFIPDTETYPVLKSVRCPAGTTKLSLMPNGAVYPCYLFFSHKEFELGNLLQDDFEKIWQSPALDYFRNFEKNTCPNSTCVLFDSCHGGCPAMSYTFYKNLGSPDPRCVGPVSKR